MIYSIGHANREPQAFIGLLKKYGIQYLADVRSAPYSSMFPAYNREALAVFLKSHGITYVFMGDTIGGLPDDDSCYISCRDKNKAPVRRISYNLLGQKPYFISGMQRLQAACAQGLDLVVMCSELHPEECHRSKLIGLALLKDGIVMQHIDRDGNLLDQHAVNLLINGGKNPINLWGEIDTHSGKRKEKEQ